MSRFGPNSNGGARQRAGAESGGERLAVLAMTGWGQAEDRSRTREAGYDGHLVKPVNYADLVTLLESFSQLS